MDFSPVLDRLIVFVIDFLLEELAIFRLFRFDEFISGTLDYKNTLFSGYSVCRLMLLSNLKIETFCEFKKDPCSTNNDSFLIFFCFLWVFLRTL